MDMINFHLRGFRIFSLVLLQGRGHVGLAEQQGHLLHRLDHLHHLLHLDISGLYKCSTLSALPILKTLSLPCFPRLLLADTNIGAIWSCTDCELRPRPPWKKETFCIKLFSTNGKLTRQGRISLLNCFCRKETSQMFYPCPPPWVKKRFCLKLFICRKEKSEGTN